MKSLPLHPCGSHEELTVGLTQAFGSRQSDPRSLSSVLHPRLMAEGQDDACQGESSTDQSAEKRLEHGGMIGGGGR